MNFRHFNIGFFSKRNVGKQLRTLFICTVLIPFILIGGIICWISARQATENYEHLSESKAVQIRSVLTTTTIYLYDVYETFTEDDELQSLLSANYQSADEAKTAFMSYDGFNRALENTASVSSLKLYIDQDILQREDSFSYYYPITDSIRSQSWYEQAESTRRNFWKCEMRTGYGSVRYWELNYYCRIPIPQTGSFAVLAVTVSNDHLRSLIPDSDYDIYISVNSDPVFFCSDRQYAGNAFPVAASSTTAYYSSTGTMDVLGTNMISSVQAFEPYATSDQIYILAADPDAYAYILRLEMVCILAITFALLISAFLITLYARYFSARIQTLRLAMYKVSHNDYEIVNSIQGDDELSATFTDLKTMVSRLKETEAQIYEAQIKEQMLSNQQHKMELKLLSSQINPHFLYNTLETIRMKAFSEGNREVATAIKTLGKTMRYVLNNTKTTSTTLDKELDYIENYLSIQKLRFGNRLNYRIEIEDTLEPENYKILPLLIQPVIENAISHGLENTGEDGMIILKLSKSPKDLLIAEVTDNGIGMTEEVLQDVLLHLNIPRPDSDHGVGLYNINNRIHLFYGESCGLTIESSPNAGTRVTITVPLLNITEELE